MGGSGDRLKSLENRSIYILREAYAEFERPAVLWSTGKDSTTVLHLSLILISEPTRPY